MNVFGVITNDLLLILRRKKSLVLMCLLCFRSSEMNSHLFLHCAVASIYEIGCLVYSSRAGFVYIILAIKFVGFGRDEEHKMQ